MRPLAGVMKLPLAGGVVANATVRVVAVRSSASGVPRDSWTEFTTGPDGSYGGIALYPGRYRVEVHHNGTVYRVGSVTVTSGPVVELIEYMAGPATPPADWELVRDALLDIIQQQSGQLADLSERVAALEEDGPPPVAARIVQPTDGITVETSRVAFVFEVRHASQATLILNDEMYPLESPFDSLELELPDGDYTATLTASRAGQEPVTDTVTFVVAAAVEPEPPQWAGLPASWTWTVGVPVSVDLGEYASGDYESIVVAEGSLPAGVTLEAGVLSGTPQAAGSASPVFGLVWPGGGPVVSAPVAIVVEGSGETYVGELTVNSDGWTADVVFYDTVTGHPLVLDPDDTPLIVLTVQGPGHELGSTKTTTVTRTVVGTKLMREPYPEQDTQRMAQAGENVIATVALSEPIYQGETVAHVQIGAGAYYNVPAGPAAVIANRSERAYPLPLCNWVTLPHERLTASGLYVEASAYHWHMQQGQQAAAVEFIAVDSLGGESAAVATAMTASARIAADHSDAPTVPVYAATIPPGALQNGPGELRLRIYPFVGPPVESTAIGEAWPTPNLPTGLPVLIDTDSSYGAPVAWVNPAGAGESPAVQADETDPGPSADFGTISAAAQAIRAYNAAHHGHDDLGGGIIMLRSGTHAGLGANMNNYPSGATWLTIRAAPGASVTYHRGSHHLIPALTRWEGIRIEATETGTSHAVLQGQDNTLPIVTYAAFIGCEVVGLNDTAAPVLSRIGMRYHLNCVLDNLGTGGLAPFSSHATHIPLLAGCVVKRCGSYQMSHALGNVFGPDAENETGAMQDPATHANRILVDPPIIVANRLMRMSGGGTATTQRLLHSRAKGFVFAQNVVERVAETLEPALQFGGDGNTADMVNALLFYNTMVGGSGNIGYVESGVSVKEFSMRFNILRRKAHKGDVHSSNGTFTGNWLTRFGVGHVGNVILDRPGSGGSAETNWLAPDSWFGDWGGLRFAPAASPQVAFTADRSGSAPNMLPPTGDGTGGGDYHLTGEANAAYARVPPNEAGLPFDIEGRPRLNDGTGAAGAYERTV